MADIAEANGESHYRPDKTQGAIDREPLSRRVHWDNHTQAVVYGDEEKGELVCGTYVYNPYRLLLAAIMVESAIRIQALRDFCNAWDMAERKPVNAAHERARAAARVTFDWITDDDPHPTALTFKVAVDLHGGKPPEVCRREIVRSLSVSAVRELLRPFKDGAIIHAGEVYVRGYDQKNSRFETHGTTVGLAL